MASETLLVDTGPLVALLNPRDPHHAWAVEALHVRATLLTCEAVISEACFLMSRARSGSARVLELIDTAPIKSVPLAGELDALRRLMTRYAAVPMSFADACLVRLAELTPRAVVFTLDDDFGGYRKNGREVIPRLAPER